MKFSDKDVNALFDAVKKVGTSVEAQAGTELAALGMYDHSFYYRILEADGEDKANEMHKKVWLKHVKDYVIEGKDDLKIDKIEDVQTVGLITKIAFEKRGCIFDIGEINPDIFVGIITRDPLKEFVEDAFQEEIRNPYMRSLARVMNSVFEGIVEECGLSASIEVTQDQSLYLGDSVTKVVYQSK
ncbi:MAG TPA: hypothetical protein DD791_03750 [Syntrophomonas sp.]|nr:hypothetical protein [Syntrophomonas sp.]